MLLSLFIIGALLCLSRVASLKSLSDAYDNYDPTNAPYPASDMPTLSPDIISRCPRGYVFFPVLMKCYSFFPMRMSWYGANQYCSAKHKRAHLLTISSPDEEHLLYENVISANNISVWTALNKVDRPSGNSFQWYLVGTRMVRDSGYRCSQLDSTIVPDTCSDYNCVAWNIDDVMNKHWQTRSCSNKPTADDRYVEGFVCQIDL